MHGLNYNRLIEQNPSSYGTYNNSIGQIIDFYEHPIYGEESQVICVCHALKLAEYSTFYEIDDMIQEHKEYEPVFKEGVLYIGDFKAN